MSLLRPAADVALLALTVILVILVDAPSAMAADPSPSAAAGGDPRSSGQGPGLVGEPLLAIGAVLAIALLAVAATTIWVRATGGRGDSGPPPQR